MKLYLCNKETKRRFEIVNIDKERGRVTLRGDHATFEEAWNPQRFKEMGYVLEKGEVDAEQ